MTYIEQQHFRGSTAPEVHMEKRVLRDLYTECRAKSRIEQYRKLKS